MTNKDIMNNRLQQFLSAENISQSQLADTLGVARASISHIIAGRNKPGFDFIENMARYYPALNLEWLITGKGKMYKSQETKTPVYDDNSDDLFAKEFSEVQEPKKPSPAPQKASSNNIDAPTERAVSKVIVFFNDGTYQEVK